MLNWISKLFGRRPLLVIRKVDKSKNYSIGGSCHDIFFHPIGDDDKEMDEELSRVCDKIWKYKKAERDVKRVNQEINGKE